MFTFTWARLGIFFAIFLGIPLVVFLGVKFSDWAEENFTPEMAMGCLIAFLFIFLGVLAGYIAFFTT